MSYTALVGFVMMILITVLLLKKKVSTLFAFTIIPIIGAFLIGSSVNDVCNYVNSGVIYASSQPPISPPSATERHSLYINLM